MDKTIYQKIKKIAEPIVKHYHTDLTEHDLKSLRGSQIGDVFLWAPRECGTQMHQIRSGENKTKPHEAYKLNECGFNWFDSSVHFHKNLQWYILEVTSKGRGHVIKVGKMEEIEKLRITKTLREHVQHHIDNVGYISG